VFVPHMQQFSSINSIIKPRHEKDGRGGSTEVTHGLFISVVSYRCKTPAFTFRLHLLRHFVSGTGKSQNSTESRGPDKNTTLQQTMKSRLLISVCLGAGICVWHIFMYMCVQTLSTLTQIHVTKFSELCNLKKSKQI